MIGAGTGMAPFRGFILERARLKAIGKPVGRMLLFFGCRRPDEDYLYREELADAASSMDGLLEIIPAFSRAENKPKTYVQDCVGAMKKEVCELLQNSANIYICGRASMAREVGRVVEEAMKQENRWSDPEVRSWAESAKKGGKWFEDVWG
jgi:NADPH-ferrihemoprotein reductase